MHDSFLLVLFHLWAAIYLPCQHQGKLKEEKGKGKKKKELLPPSPDKANWSVSTPFYSCRRTAFPAHRRDRRFKRGKKQDFHWEYRFKIIRKNRRKGQKALKERDENRFHKQGAKSSINSLIDDGSVTDFCPVEPPLHKATVRLNCYQGPEFLSLPPSFTPRERSQEGLSALH